MKMIWGWFLVLGLVGGSVQSPLPQLYQDTPSPPVILEEGEQYNDEIEDQYIDYEYSSLKEDDLKEIHTKLYASTENNTSPELDDIEEDRLELEHLIGDDAPVKYEPPGVEITAVVSHSPESEEEEGETVGEPHLGASIDGENEERSSIAGDSQPSLVSKEKLDDLTLTLTWWQILLLVIACLLLTSLCCYFSGCCFLTADCCSDPFWGCCPCCGSCVRLLKPPPHTSGTKPRDRKAPSSYSLNENNTAPRSSVDRTSVSLSRLDRGSSRSINLQERSSSNGRMKTSTPLKPERRSSRASIRNYTVQATQDDSLASSGSVRSVRNYRRLSHTNSTKNSSSLGRRNSLQDSAAGRSEDRGRPEDSLRRERKNSNLRGGHSSDWVYEDSSGYFSWISKLGSKKKQYQIHTRKKNNKSSQNNIYRQSRYRHIAESRNSAVIPVKISKRSSNASNYNVRPLRCRSVESISSDEETSQPFLQTKSERHIPSRLSTNLADLENRRNRRQSGCSTPVSCPTVPESTEFTPGEPYNLKYFEKSLLSSKETTL